MCQLRMKSDCTGESEQVVRIFHGDQSILACTKCAPTSTGFCATHGCAKERDSDGNLYCNGCEDEASLPRLIPRPYVDSATWVK